MSGTIKAIETRYAGHRFRSRLEARWAVFFDTLGMKWEYEPQGYTVDDECYLPDFWLPETETWVEVKGSSEGLRADSERLTTILDGNSPLPGMMDSHGTSGDVCHGMLFLGPVPAPSSLILHPIVQHREGLWWEWAYFVPRTSGAYIRTLANPGPELAFFYHVPECVAWSAAPLEVASPYTYPVVKDAYAAARSARFEHGERG